MPIPDRDPTGVLAPTWPEPHRSTWPESQPVAFGETLLRGFTTNLFVQARAEERVEAARLMGHTGVGAVFTVEHRRRVKPYRYAAETVRAAQAITDSANILLDRNCYSGNDRKTPEYGLDPGWVRLQRDELRLPWALTDSAYCASVADVRTVLESASSLGPRVITEIPVAHQVIRDEAAAVLDLLSSHDQYTAIILEHPDDPCDEDGVIAGLTHILHGARLRPLLLRSDTSAVGAIAHGAPVGAVGAHSGERHLYPASDGGGFAEKLAFVIPDLLGYYLHTRFARAYTQDPNLAAWSCRCWFCSARDLTWIAEEPDRRAQLTAAFQHSVAALAGVGTALMTRSATTTPAQAWDLMCAQAQAEHGRVSNPSGSEWQPKAALKHWRAVTPRLPVS